MSDDALYDRATRACPGCGDVIVATSQTPVSADAIARLWTSAKARHACPRNRFFAALNIQRTGDEPV